MKNQEEHVFIGQYESTFIFKAEGRLTQKSLWNTRVAIKRCAENESITYLLIDLSQCAYMDSTILGVLARWAITFAQSHQALPFLVGLKGNPLENIFCRMNLITLFHVSDALDTVEKSQLSQLSWSGQFSKGEYAEHLLSAHETLAELSPQNAKEFAAVIQCLKAELNTT